ncbi:MAG: TRAP transporter small permease subunit [Deinococcales bacterium]
MKRLRQFANAVAALLMFVMFATFILQVVIRYSARLEWIAEAIPLLDPARFGWTLEFCLALWVWLVFLGNAFVVRDQDHVTFDILYMAVGPRLRRLFVILGGLAICITFIMSIQPTWERFYILRLKKTATLSELFGSWIRMRHIYSVYILFLVAVVIRYLYYVWNAIRKGVPTPAPLSPHHGEGRLDQ